MFFKLLAIASLALSSLVAASPVEIDLMKRVTETSLAKRAVLYGQWDSESVSNGYYTLYNNLWGERSGRGSQKTYVTSVKGKRVTWKTEYIWSGDPTRVKSYANLGLNAGLNKQLREISSIPTDWDWTYTSASSGLDASVSYDLWLSNAAGGSDTDEIMIWLSARGGASPAGFQIATFNFDNITWKLFRRILPTKTTWTFLAPHEITAFSTDLRPFFTYLVKYQGLSNNKFLTKVQVGTEPFVGSATLSTIGFSVTVN